MTQPVHDWIGSNYLNRCNYRDVITITIITLFSSQHRRWPEKRPVELKKKKLQHDQCRIKEFFLFYLLIPAERTYSAEVATKAGSDLHNLSFVNLHSSFHLVSSKVSAHCILRSKFPLTEISPVTFLGVPVL